MQSEVFNLEIYQHHQQRLNEKTFLKNDVIVWTAYIIPKINKMQRGSQV